MSKGRLPDFIIIGAAKAGTTWLGARLGVQPGVFLSDPMEIHYFDRNDNYEKGADWYARCFENAAAGDLIGEKTPNYLWAIRPDGAQDIPERMHNLLPDARLIVAMRDPVERAVSALNHFIRARRLPPSIDADKILTEVLGDVDGDRFGIIGQGLYARNLKRYLKLYPRRQVHIVFFEDDIKKAPQDTLNATMRFLGREAINPARQQASARNLVSNWRWWPENKRMNSRMGLTVNYYVPALGPLVSVIDRMLPEQPAVAPSAQCRARLNEYFAPHNDALFDLVERTTSAWSGRS